MSTVVGTWDLDLNLTKGELVAVISEADSRGDRRRWLVDAGGETSGFMTFALKPERKNCGAICWQAAVITTETDEQPMGSLCEGTPGWSDTVNK